MPINNQNAIDLGLGALEFGNYVNSVFSSYSDVGAIKSELSIDIEREVLSFESGRPLITIVQQVIREKVMIKATLAELNMAVVKQVLGQGDVFSGSVPTFLDGSQTALRGNLQTGYTAVQSGTLLKFGGLPTIAYIGLRFTHQRADGGRIIFEGYRASPMGKLTLPFKEADWNLYEVQFNLLANTCQPAGEQYFQLFEEALPTPPSC